MVRSVNVKKTKKKQSSKKIVLKITMSMTERGVGVCSVGKNVEIVEIASGDVGRHREA